MVDPTLIAELKAALPPEAIVEGQALAERRSDWRGQVPVRAALLLRPADTAQVALVVKACHAAGQPLVMHGGLTGLVHGADTGPDDLVLSLERMRSIESIDPLQRVAVVQAGVTLQALQEAADAAGLAFPLDLGARGSATLGGNASTNAGGNRVLRYGMTRELVLGLEVVLADGSVLPAMNRLIKNNSGYDLKHLFIGAEGTLGVITRLVLRLREKAARQDVALVALPSFDAVTGLLKHMDRHLGGALSAFEAMWPEFYELVTTPPAQGRPPLPHGAAFYVLVEAQGGPGDGPRFAAALEAAADAGLVADAAIAQSQADVAAIWGLRDDVLQTGRFGAPLAFDVSLPIAAMPGYVDGVKDALHERYPMAHAWVFGHLGDGNLHVVVSSNGLPEGARDGIEAIVYAPLRSLGGAVSAEHGIGLEKKRWLHLSRSTEEVALMRRLKAALDPRAILNPGRVA